jgi:hypothetical protein
MSARLVVLYHDEQQREVVDIIHEALIRQWPRLSGWMNEERFYLLTADELQRVRRRWEDNRLSERLLRGFDLEQSLANRERLRADHPELHSLIETSLERSEKERAGLKADALWEPLEFQFARISQRELESLRKLSKADDRVRRAFLERLHEIPDRARRFCRLPHLVVRAALGLRRNCHELVADILRSGFAVESSPEVVAAMLFLSAFSGVEDPSVDAALDACSREGLNDELAEGIAAWASVFAIHWDGKRACRAFDRVLGAIDQISEENPCDKVLGQAAQVLALRMDADWPNARSAACCTPTGSSLMTVRVMRSAELRRRLHSGWTLTTPPARSTKYRTRSTRPRTPTN